MNEQEAIRRAFERVDPPAGFAARVLDRIDREEKVVQRSRWSRQWLRHAVAAGLALAIGLSAVAGWNWNQQKRGEAAAAEALIALRIASEKVNLAKQTVQERSAF